MYPLSKINFKRTYQLWGEYENIKERASQILGKYLGYPNLFTFNDLERSITFTTERLIPTASTNRMRVMLLFSNPHPHSIQQGMFLSPNTKGRENLFWPAMADAGWLPISKENRKPKLLANICLNAEYAGPFELVFYCYYAFPTDYPEDIKKIFGKKFFTQHIQPEAKNEFRRTVQETGVETVVTFNKGIFNLVSEDHIDRYIECLLEGNLIQSQIKAIERNVPIFLTFPTGWRYHKDFRHLRKASLDKIKTSIFKS